MDEMKDVMRELKRLEQLEEKFDELSIFKDRQSVKGNEQKNATVEEHNKKGSAVPKRKTYDDQELELMITGYMHKIGVPVHIKGYNYLREAIKMWYNNPNIGITTNIYPTIARKYETEPKNVERAMRHAVELVWSRGNVEFLYKIFSYTIDPNKGKTTNSEFISMIADHIKHENS